MCIEGQEWSYDKKCMRPRCRTWRRANDYIWNCNCRDCWWVRLTRWGLPLGMTALGLLIGSLLMWQFQSYMESQPISGAPVPKEDRDRLQQSTGASSWSSDEPRPHPRADSSTPQTPAPRSPPTKTPPPAQAGKPSKPILLQPRE